MFTIGLTGGIGSGKSRVADWLAQWGAAVVDADAISHELTEPGGAAIGALRAAFGTAVIAPDGRMDRAWMRERAFSDATARRCLEDILHPLIARGIQARAAQAVGPYLVVVVPLLVESGSWRKCFDRICVVDCDPPTQIRRVRLRSRLTQEAIERIMVAQASRQDRLAVADDVILNDGATDLETLCQRARDFHDAWCDRALRLSTGPRSPQE